MSSDQAGMAGITAPASLGDRVGHRNPSLRDGLLAGAHCVAAQPVLQGERFI